jgi:hypothetical protein
MARGIRLKRCNLETEKLGHIGKKFKRFAVWPKEAMRLMEEAGRSPPVPHSREFQPGFSPDMAQ